MDLEFASADGGLDARAVPAGLLQRTRHRGLAHSEQPEHAPSWRLRPRKQLPHRLTRERVRPQPPQLAGRTGKNDDNATGRGAEDEARGRPCEPDRTRGGRPRRLFRHARREVRVRPPQALRDRARDRLDLLLERFVDDELDPRRAPEHLHGPVVVRRAETAGDETRVRIQPLAQRRLQLGRRVSDDRDAGGLEPMCQRLGSEERAVAVGALAADELAAGDDDDGPRPRAQQWRRVVRCGVTRTQRLCMFGNATARPLSVMSRPAGLRTRR